MRKRFMPLFAFVILLLLSSQGLAAEVEFGTKNAKDVFTVYEDAILYSIENDILQFNVVHSGDIRGAAIVDKTGSGITKAAGLKEIMGTPDAPPAVLGTDVAGRTLGKAVTANLELDRRSNILAVTITDIRDRPVVGISWKRDLISTDYMGFAEAFERNGAFAVYLPQVETAAQAREVLSKIQGLFETGGEDWNPSLYGEEQTPHGSAGWNDARDTSDIHLMQQAISLDVPLFAVCRGAQGLNVALGGGLIQDVPYYLGQKVLSGEIDKSRVTEEIVDNGYWKWNPVSQDYARVASTDCDHYRVCVDGLIHSGGTGYHNLNAGENIGIDANSKWLYDIIGYTSLEWVATAHHQAVNPERLGRGLTIVAHSSDGIVEAVEYQDNVFALAVQWHPERDALRDTRGIDVDQDECNAPLRALVKYAGVYADKDRESENASSSSGCNAGQLTGLLLLMFAATFAAKRVW